MEKWKKKIIKQMYKQWFSKDKVSAEMIVQYFCNSQNSWEIIDEMFKCLYRSPRYKFWIPIWGFIYEKIYPRKKIINEG